MSATAVNGTIPVGPYDTSQRTISDFVIRDAYMAFVESGAGVPTLIHANPGVYWAWRTDIEANSRFVPVGDFRFRKAIVRPDPTMDGWKAQVVESIPYGEASR